MPFGLPLEVSSNIIRFTLNDRTKNYSKRWKMLYDVVCKKSPEFTDTKEELNEKGLEQEAEKRKKNKKASKNGKRSK
ncbi:unnamed protein product [Rhizophagus irregularis]|nr:unnamed protein product [Rhizophagus irregularis]CAB4430945.1 unnamed protein product [Rhizophagus irregularis]